eukprot:6172911-Pleurochrysis_carterae.AAC.2
MTSAPTASHQQRESHSVKNRLKAVCTARLQPVCAARTISASAQSGSQVCMDSSVVGVGGRCVSRREQASHSQSACNVGARSASSAVMLIGSMLSGNAAYR